MYNSYYSAPSRPRVLYAPQEKVSVEEAGKMIQAGVGNIQNVLLRAGQEALRCSGPGWDPQYDIKLSPPSSTPLFLNLAGFKRIEMGINPKLLLARGLEAQKAGTGKNPLAILENAAGAHVRLFAGYFDICPWDGWRHRNLIRAAAWGAFGYPMVSGDEEKLAAAVALFFERCVVAHALTEIEEDLFVAGIVSERLINGRPYNLFEALFERVQGMLFRKVWAKVLKSVPHKEDPVADALFPEVARLIFGGRIRYLRGYPVLRGKRERPGPWLWTSLVEELAEMLAPYIQNSNNDASTQSRSGPFQNRIRPSGTPPNGGGPQNGNRPPIASGTNHITNEYNPLGVGRIPPTAPPGSTPPGRPRPRTRPNVRPAPPVISKFEVMDKYYSEHADALVVRDRTGKSPEREPENITVGYLDSEKASLTDILSHPIDWFRTRPVEPNRQNPFGLQFYKRVGPLEISALCGGNPTPHLILACDSSGSMTFPHIGSGMYHIVLMAAYGMFRHIRESARADSIKVHGLNFSNCTLSSGWQPCSNLEKVKRTIATYQGGNTALDVRILRDAVATKPGRFLAAIITDGIIGNTPDVLKVFGEIVEGDDEVVLLHIGKPNAFTEGIRALGCPVHILNKADDLVGLCLDLAKEKYKATA
jgi:hypothetical protein